MSALIFKRTPAYAAAFGVSILTLALSGPAISQTPQTHTAAHAAKEDSAKDNAEDVEERIKSMHHQLGITSAQEPLWHDVSEVMRENQREMQQAIERRQQAKTMTEAIGDFFASALSAVFHGCLPCSAQRGVLSFCCGTPAGGSFVASRRRCVVRVLPSFRSKADRDRSCPPVRLRN